MFKGNAISCLDSGHYFYIGELAKYGLAIMSNGEFGIVKAAEGVPNLIKNTIATTVLDFCQEATDGGASWYYMKNMDNGDVQKTSMTKDEVQELITYVDTKTYAERINDLNVSDKEKKIRKIQNSEFGSLWQEYTKQETVGPSAESKTVTYLNKLYFHKKHVERKERVPAFKGGTLIADHPRRKSGAKYAHKHTLGAKRYAIENGKTSTGIYVGDINLTEFDYASMVAAPLKLYYNQNQAMWETNSIFLVSLLEDIDAADNLAPALDKDNLDYEPSEFYGKEPPAKLWDYKTGLAIPLSVQDNNPRSFGPNIIQKWNSGKSKYDSTVEKVRVVNRTGQIFRSGEVALCINVDGENLLLRMGEGGVVEIRPPSFTSPWLFSKFLASSDDYFRRADDTRINPGQECIDEVHKCITNHSSAIGLRGYIQDTSHSMTGTDSNSQGVKLIGGKLNQNKDAYSSRINVSVPFGDNEETIIDSITCNDIKLFWGPVFSNGHATSVGRHDKNQTPADVAACGPLRGDDGNYDGSPIEDHEKILLLINSIDGTTEINLAKLCRNYNNNATDGTPDRFLYGPDIVQTAGDGTVTKTATGNNSKPNDPSTIQFSLLSADVYGHLDQNAGNIVGFTRNQANHARDHYTSCGDFSNYDAGTNLFGGRTFGPYAPTVAEAYSHLYGAAPPGGYTGPKYDAYITKEPLNRPQASYEIYGDDGAYRGANAVGMTCARRLAYNKGGWTLNVDTEQVYGTQGVFYGGAVGGGISLSILPGIGGWVNDTTGQLISGTTQVYGSSLDSIDSFGTAALNVQVWDGWPREWCMWLPQYAVPLHFSDLPVYTSTVFQVQTWNAQEGKTEEDTITVGDIACRYDYRDPTFGDKHNDTRSYNTGRDGQTVPLGEIPPLGDDETETLRPQEYWNINISRRGRFLTYYGRVWQKRVIGLSNQFSIEFSGSAESFVTGDIIECDRGVFVECTAGGGTPAFKFAKSDQLTPDASVYQEKYGGVDPTKHTYRTRGEGFEPQEFPYKLVIPSINGGEDAEMICDVAECYEIPQLDYGPKPRSSMTRCSRASGAGQKRVTGTKSTQIGVLDNLDPNNPYPGEYEIFAYCHNDIGICLHKAPDATSGTQMHNYIKATFS